MNNRKRKAKIYSSYSFRDIRWTAEDLAWLNMAPVGREFGSPEFERLSKLEKSI